MASSHKIWKEIGALLMRGLNNREFVSIAFDSSERLCAQSHRSGLSGFESACRLTPLQRAAAATAASSQQ